MDLGNGAGFTLCGMLSDFGAAGLLRAVLRLDAASLSRAVFPIFVVGLASSVTLSESTLAVLTVRCGSGACAIRPYGEISPGRWESSSRSSSWRLSCRPSRRTSPGRSLLAARGTAHRVRVLRHRRHASGRRPYRAIPRPVRDPAGRCSAPWASSRSRRARRRPRRCGRSAGSTRGASGPAGPSAST